MKKNLTALVTGNTKQSQKFLQILKQVGTTHWKHVTTSNQMRLHFRKNGTPSISLIDERIGAEWGVNLAQELRIAGCSNIVLFNKKSDPNSILKILKKDTRCLVFKDDFSQEQINWNLTKTEIKILKYLSLGFNQSQIAQELKISITKFKRLRKILHEKTNIHDQTVLVATALRNGVIG